MKTPSITAFRRVLASALLLVSLAAQALAAEPYYRPALADLDAQLSYLKYVQEHIPFLFEETATYDKDIFELLNNEQTLMTALQADPGYQAIAGRRDELLQIKMETLAPGRGTIRQLRAGADAEWKSELTAAVDQLIHAQGAGTSAKAAISSALQEAIPALMQKNPSGMLTGLINSLPKERRGAAFKLGASEQLSYLAQNLSDDEFNQNFKASNFGLDASHLTRADVLAIVDTMLKQERAAQSIAKLAVLAEQETTGGTLEALRAQVSSSDAKALNAIISPKAVEKALASLDSGLSGWKKTAGTFGSRTESSFKNSVESIEGDVPVVSETHTLREVPANLALFRGFIGGDCSTSFSYGFAYVPTERYFFLYDQTGRLKGYIGSTVVEINGVKTLYVHDGTGKYMKPTELTRAIHALYLARGKIGVDQVSLALNSVASGNSHFPPLVAALKTLTDGKPEVLQTFSDEAIRLIVTNNGSSVSYDGVDRNKNAIILEPNAEVLSSIQIETSHAEVPVYEPQPLSKSVALKLGLDFAKTRPAASKRALVAAGISDEQYTALNALLANNEALPLADYYAKITEAFAQYDLAVDQEFRTKREFLFASGHLKAPDALTTQNPEYKKLTTQAIYSGLTGPAGTPGYLKAIALIKDHPELATKNPKILSHFSDLATLERINDFYQALNSGLPAAVFAGQIEGLKTIARASEQHIAYRGGAARVLAELGEDIQEFVPSALDALAYSQDYYYRIAIVILKEAKTLSPEALERLKNSNTSTPELLATKLAILHKHGVTTLDLVTQLQAYLDGGQVSAQFRPYIESQLTDARAMTHDASRTEFFDQMMAKLQAAAPDAHPKTLYSAEEKKALALSIKWGLKSARTREQAQRVKETLRARNVRHAVP